jgi:hypothetical protein
VTQLGSISDNDGEDEVESNVFFISANFQATETLSINADFTFTDATSEMDTPVFGAPPAGIDYSIAQSPTRNLNYYVDFAGFDDYSNLDYQIIDTSIGFDWEIFKNIIVSANLRYINFDDDEPYVYGDQDGELYIINAGLTYRF